MIGFQRNCRSLRIPFFAEKMCTLDDDMAQEGDIAELQENFNEDVEQNIQMDHLRQRNEELLEISKKQTEKIKNIIKETEDVKQKTRKIGKLITKVKQLRRLDSLRPRTTPKKYKF
jgi:polyhydroxyalkanoate synthesis regulator phasin